jgi:outer membrane lipoprotein-sorting protein
MFLSNPAKSFLACILLLFLVGGCGFLETGENKPVLIVPETKSRIPFKTKEPETFQCEVVVTTGDATRRTLLARKGERRRIDFDPGEKDQRAVLRSEKEYVLAFDKKIYAEKAAPTGPISADAQFSELTSELLTRGERAEFEEIGREGSIVKYVVHLEGGEANEILVYFDEAIGLPVKQEFLTISGAERTLQYSVEIVNFRTDVDESLFAVPAGFRKVSLSEFHNLLR